MCPLNLLSIIVWSLFIWRAHGVMRWPSMFMIHQEHVIWAFTTYMNFSMEVIHEFYLFYQTFSFQWMNATTCWGRTDYTLLEQVNIWSTLFIFWISEKSWLHHLSTGKSRLLHTKIWPSQLLFSVEMIMHILKIKWISSMLFKETKMMWSLENSNTSYF